MKKIIFTFIMLAACAVGWAEDSETIGGNIANSNLTWEITVDSVLKISGSGDMPADFGSWDHEGGLRRTSAPWREHYKKVKYLEIGENVTSVGDNAFRACIYLVSVNQLSSCTKIGKYAFQDCRLLLEIGNLGNCISIGECAFCNCYTLTSIGDLSACTSIGVNAFRSCSSLTTVGNLTTCESIGESAFSNCKSLTGIGNLSACTSIGNNAFSDCNNLTSIGDLSACTSIGEYAFWRCGMLYSIGDLSACTSIGNAAFKDCPLSEITIGDATTIPNSSYETIPTCMTILVPEDKVETYRTAEYWSSLAERIISKDAQHDFDIDITITPSVGSAIQNAVETQGGDVANVMSLKVKGDINAYDIFLIRNKMPNLHDIDLTDANIKKTADGYKYFKSYTTEDNVFPTCGFSGLVKIISMKFPNSVKKFGLSCCSDCTNLMGDLNLHEGTEFVDETAFYQCTHITSVNIPNGCKSVGPYAFSGCERAKIINIGEGCKFIGRRAFKCGLESISIGAGCETISDEVFEDCTSLKTVSLPNTITSIGDKAFWKCGISSISLPSSLSSIGNGTFQYCHGLTEIVLPAALTNIGPSAFSNCSNLNTVKVTAVEPNSITLYESSFDNYSTKKLYVPYDEQTGWIASKNAYYWHTQWGQFGTLDTWKPIYDYVNIIADYDQNIGTIPGENIDLRINEKAGYILGTSASQNFNNVHVIDDGNTSGSIIAESNLTVSKLFSDIKIYANRWYFFSFPFDVILADIVTPEGSKYVFRTYDGAKRAEQGSGGVDKIICRNNNLNRRQGIYFPV